MIARRRALSFNQSFHLVMLLLAIWSFTAMSATGHMPLWLVAISYPVIAGSWIVGRRKPAPGWAANLVAIPALLFGGWMLRYGRMEAIGSVLLFLLALKFIVKRKPRDNLQIILISLFIMIITAVVTMSLGFVPFFLGFVMLFILALTFLTIRREHEWLSAHGAGVEEGVEPRSPLPIGMYRRSAMAVLGILAMTTVIFLTFPRISTGSLFEGLRARAEEAISGYSDEIDLQGSSRIKLSGATVMRVRVQSLLDPNLEKPLNSLRLRGSVVELYRDGRWLASSRAHYARKFLINHNSEVAMANRAPGDSQPFRQSITLQMTRSKRLFALNAPTRIQINQKGPIQLEFDARSSTVRIDNIAPEVLSYNVWSSVRTREAVEREAAQMEARGVMQRSRQMQRNPVMDVFLKLPDTPRAAEMTALAQSIVEEAGAETPYRAARAIETWFHANFAYSLRNLNYSADSPTEDFVLDGRQGHCEFFASGMAHLLRRIDIPCRIVNGYYSNRWNSVGNYFMVEEADAHAWVEAHIPNLGWVMFDPTPPGSIDRAADEIVILTPLAQWFDSVRLKWHLYVIDYDLNDQTELFGMLRPEDVQFLSFLAPTGVTRAIRRAEWRSVAQKGMVAVAIGVAAAFVFLIGSGSAARLFRGRWISWTRGSKRHWRRVELYEDILKTLEKRVMARALHITPLEYAGAVERERPELSGFRDITSRYYHVRFGEHELTHEDEKSFRQFLGVAKRVNGRKRNNGS